MTTKKAIKIIDSTIESKNRLIKVQEDLLKSWGPQPENDTPTKTCKGMIEFLQYDISILTEIKNQIKSKVDPMKKGKRASTAQDR